MLSRLFAATIATGVLFAGRAYPATIQIGLYGTTTIITVVGKLETDDGQNFAERVSGLRDAVVVLNSPGGSLVAGLRIGTIIRLKKFATVVPDGTRCASACAIAWLGGTSRYMGQQGAVGFHAVYTMENGTPAETGAGNALLGAYLSRLGLSDNAVLYITSAPPTAMNWLSIDDAKALGIDVIVLPAAGPQQVAPAAAPPIKSDQRVAPDAPAPRSISLEKVAETFADTYFAHWSESNAEALQFFGQAYAETIKFYDHLVPRRLLMDQKRDFATRWPERIYTTHPSTIKASCDQHTRLCTITGQVEWDCRDPNRNQRSIGLADFTLQIAMSGGGAVKVTGEWSSVVSKH
jgi:hypothetical protein